MSIFNRQKEFYIWLENYFTSEYVEKYHNTFKAPSIETAIDAWLRLYIQDSPCEILLAVKEVGATKVNVFQVKTEVGVKYTYTKVN